METMNDYLVDMARILEVESVNEDDVLRDFELWDSLTVLAVLAFVDETYRVNVSALEMADVETLKDLHQLIESKK
jgi:acyl carrier protein